MSRLSKISAAPMDCGLEDLPIDVTINGQVFVLDSPLYLGGMEGLSFTGCRFETSDGFKGSHLVNVGDSTHITMTGCTLDSTGMECEYVLHC